MFNALKMQKQEQDFKVFHTNKYQIEGGLLFDSLLKDSEFSKLQSSSSNTSVVIKKKEETNTETNETDETTT